MRASEQISGFRKIGPNKNGQNEILDAFAFKNNNGGGGGGGTSPKYIWPCRNNSLLTQWATHQTKLQLYVFVRKIKCWRLIFADFNKYDPSYYNGVPRACNPVDATDLYGCSLISQMWSNHVECKKHARGTFFCNGRSTYALDLKCRLLLRSWWHSSARSHMVRIRQKFWHQHRDSPREVGRYVFFVCLTLVNTNNTLIWHLVILRPWLPYSMRSAGKGDSPRSCRTVQEAKSTRALFGRRMQG